MMDPFYKGAGGVHRLYAPFPAKAEKLRHGSVRPNDERSPGRHLLQTFYRMHALPFQFLYHQFIVNDLSPGINAVFKGGFPVAYIHRPAYTKAESAVFGYQQLHFAAPT